MSGSCDPSRRTRRSSAARRNDMEPESHPSFVMRLWLCWAVFFRVLFDPEFAAHVERARQGLPALPAPEPEAPAPPELAEPSSRSAPVKAADGSAALQLL